MITETVKVADCKRDRHVILKDDEVTGHMVLGFLIDIPLVECLDDVIHANNPDKTLA